MTSTTTTITSASASTRQQLPPPSPPAYPLYGPTYTLYRVSPLYNGTTPILASLAIHARRFRDIIKGDVLRGIQLTHELQPQQQGSTSRAAAGSDRGAFKSCSWELLADEAAWTRIHAGRSGGGAGDGYDDDDDDDDDEMMDALAHVGVAEAKGVRIEVVYERATYVGILVAASALASTSSSSSSSAVLDSSAGSGGGPRNKARNGVVANGFTHLPILLVKMPVPLREALTGYLTTAFDARIAPMKLRSGVMASVLETVLDKTLGPVERDLRQVTSFPKGLHLQLAFPCTTPQLRTLDVHIEQADLLGFLQRGRQLIKQSQRPSRPQLRNNNNNYNSTATSTSEAASAAATAGPFITALDAYLRQHLALSLHHPAITIHRIALGPYSLAADGKAKIAAAVPDITPLVWQILFSAAAASSSSSSSTASITNTNDNAAAATRLLGSKAQLLKQAQERADRMSGLQWHDNTANDNHGGAGGTSGGTGGGSTTTSASNKEQRMPSDPPPPYEMHDPALRDELME